MNKVAVALACVILAACASGSGGSASATPQPKVQLVQLTGPADLNYPPGRFDVQFGVRIENVSTEPITLRQIVMEPASAGGPYRVLRDRYHFNHQIAGSGAHEFDFWAHAAATGTANSIDANAPVTVRATLYFDSPAGGLRKIVIANLDQGRSGF